MVLRLRIWAETAGADSPSASAAAVSDAAIHHLAEGAQLLQRDRIGPGFHFS